MGVRKEIMSLTVIDLINSTEEKHLDYEIRISCYEKDHTIDHSKYSLKTSLAYGIEGVDPQPYYNKNSSSTLGDFYKLREKKDVKDLDEFFLCDHDGGVIIYIEFMVIDDEHNFIIMI